jgi:hypothetical protein
MPLTKREFRQICLAIDVMQRSSVTEQGFDSIHAHNVKAILNSYVEEEIKELEDKNEQSTL